MDCVNGKCGIVGCGIVRSGIVDITISPQIETLYDERMEQQADKAAIGPHITMTHKDNHILEDARNLIIHHLRRQSHLQNEEKAKVKVFLNGFLQDFFFAPRGYILFDIPYL